MARQNNRCYTRQDLEDEATAGTFEYDSGVSGTASPKNRLPPKSEWESYVRNLTDAGIPANRVLSWAQWLDLRDVGPDGIPSAPSVNDVSACVAGTGVPDYQADLAWANGDATAETEVWDCTSAGSPTTLLATRAAGVNTYRHESPGTGNSYYRVRHKKLDDQGQILYSDFSGTGSVSIAVRDCDPDGWSTEPFETGSTQTTVAFSWARADGKDSVKLHHRLAGQATWNFVTTVNAESYNFTGLADLTDHEFLFVQTYNGVDAHAVEKVASTGGFPPDGPPSSPVASSGGETSINCSWTSGDAAAQTVVSLYTGGGNFVSSQTVGAGVASASFGGLAPNTSFYFTAHHTKNGYSSSSVQSNTTNTDVDGPGCPPTNVVAISPSAWTLDVSWSNCDTAADTEISVQQNGVEVGWFRASAGETTARLGGGAGSGFELPSGQVDVYVWHAKNQVHSTSVHITASVLDGPSGSPSGLSSQDSSFCSGIGGEEPNYEVYLTWTNGDPSAETEIFEGGIRVKTEAAGVSSYRDLVGQTGSYSYYVRHKKNGAVSGTSSSSVTVGTLDCTNPVYGCTDPDADNYDPNATHDDGSCTYGGGGGPGGPGGPGT